jgi:hypothetical protein
VGVPYLDVTVTERATFSRSGDALIDLFHRDIDQSTPAEALAIPGRGTKLDSFMDCLIWKKKAKERVQPSRERGRVGRSRVGPLYGSESGEVVPEYEPVPSATNVRPWPV